MQVQTSPEVSPEQVQIRQLQDFVQSRPDSREVLRALAVKCSLQGFSGETISTLLDVSVSFVSKWKRVFGEYGVEGLRLGYQGSAAFLSPAERAAVLDWLRSQSHWSLAALKAHLAQTYEVLFSSDQSYYQLLKEAELTYKKAQPTNPKADPALIASKKKRSRGSSTTCAGRLPLKR